MRITPPAAHGGDLVSVASSLGIDPTSILDLSASLNPFAPDVASMLADHAAAVGSYPDDSFATDALSEELGVDRDLVVLTNGGSEAIALVAAEVGVGRIVDPEFSLYRRHLPLVSLSAGRWRSNPSNPLGQLAETEETATVWDEAFYPLATGQWTRGDADSWRLGSLTKLWACPGLRLGFVIAPTPESARAIRLRRPMWSVNGLALSLLPDLLALTDLPTWSGLITETRQHMASSIRRMGIETTESSANWLLLHDVAGIRSPLAKRGVLVRDCTNFGLPGIVRLAVSTPSRIPDVLHSLTSALASIRAGS